jgi:hypothetical protein
MTDYNDFVHDFPARCQDVLELAYAPAMAKDREVTLLIMTAAAAFLVPFERLRGGTSTEHPAQDRRLYPELAQHLDVALERPFVESPFRNGGPGSWSAGKNDNLEASTEFKPLTKRTPAAAVLAVIRNALAHGNLFTIGGQNSPIEAVMFVSEDRKHGGYRCIRVSPTDFHEFLVSWFGFLNRKKISPAVVAQAFELWEDKESPN